MIYKFKYTQKIVELLISSSRYINSNAFYKLLLFSLENSTENEDSKMRDENYF